MGHGWQIGRKEWLRKDVKKQSSQMVSLGGLDRKSVFYP